MDVERRYYMGLRIVLTVCVAAGLAGSACESFSDNNEGGTQMAQSRKDIRPAVFAGEWYSDDPESLKRTILRYLEEAKVQPGLGDIKGLISPHAGYMYSGPVAAHAYKQVQGRHYNTVVVISPNHVDPQLRYSSVLTKGGYDTPFGVIPVDSDMANTIADYSEDDDVRASDAGHLSGYGGRMEHSLEIQLPFLKVALDDFKLVPIVMGRQDLESCHMLAEAVAVAAKDKDVLLVASSDLSHFHNGKVADKLDSTIARYVSAYEPENIMKGLTQKECEACGGAPVVSVMIAARKLGATKSAILHMANSGDVTGDYSSVVGYMAAALYSPDGDDHSEVGVDLGLSEKEKDVLRDVVERTLDSVVNGGSVPNFDDHSGKLSEHWGAFVTLNLRGRLRGCIGHIIGTQPLIDTVAQMARAAALEDPRFKPVTPGELKDIEFEISVLTPIEKVENLDDIVIGRDGLIITRGYHRGLLLPQVATEYNWDRDTFLSQTCVKAGLPRDAWTREGTVVEKFSAMVFE